MSTVSLCRNRFAIVKHSSRTPSGQLALTQADGGNKRKIGEVVEGARIVCEEQGTVTGSEFVVMGEVLRR